MEEQVGVWVRHSGSALEALYRKTAAGAAPWPALSVAAHDPTALALGRAAWQGHMANEYRTALVLTRYHWLLLVAGVPIDMSGCVGRIVSDEIRHADMCAGITTMLGAAPRSALPPGGHDLPIDAGRPLFDQILEMTVHLLCGGETLSARMLDASRKVAAKGPIKDALTAIQGDETFHAEFGWHAAGLFWDGADASARDGLQASLPAYFAGLEKACTLEGPTPPATPGAEAFGVLAPADHLATFHAAVEGDILPRLDRLGLDATGAWAARGAVGG